MPSATAIDGIRQAARLGRPPEPVPQDLADEIVEWVADGKTLRAFSQLPGRPSWRTIYDWLRKDPDFHTRFEDARQVGFDALAEECLAIADELPGDRQGDPQFVQRQRLRIDARLKLLARWCPRRYGNKITLGGDPDGAPIRLTDTERMHRLRATLGAAAARPKPADPQRCSSGHAARSPT